MAEGTEINEENYRALQREIINTQNKLANLKNENSGWNKAGNYLTKLSGTLDTISNKMNSLGNKLTVGVTAPIVAGFTAMTKSAIETETAMQQVEHIYGDASKAIKDFAENTAISFNMSSSEAYKYSQIYGNLIQSITNDQTENAKYTQDLLKASAVIASATGRTMEDVMDRIRSGLLGNTEAIEDLGVNVNVALLESTDAFKKFAGDKSWDKLDFQTQQQIRLFGILEQTTKKYGKEINKNTSSSIQELTAKTKNLTNDLGEKLLPIANDLLEEVNDLIDQFGKLSDEEQQNIIKMGLMVVSAGPLLKAGSSAINIIGTTTKALGTMTKAIGLAKNGIGDATGASATLAKGLKSIVSPAGIVTTTLAAFAAGVALTKAKVDEEYKSLTQLNEELKNNNELRENELETIEKQRNASLAEINTVETLRKELDTLVNTNGKVKEGYESRAKFILGELNKALGTEYSMTGDIINNYKNLISTIDELIIKKKAQIILEANEEEYKTAIQNKDQLYKDHIKTVEELREKQKRVNELIEESKHGFIGSEQSLAKNSLEMQKLSEEIKKLDENCNNQINQLNKYNNAITNYEKNTELMLEGGVENYKKIEQSVATTQQNITNIANEGLKERIQKQIEANEQSKKEYALEVKYNEDAKNSIYANNVIEGKKALQLLTEQLIAQTSTVENLSQDQIDAWKALAKADYDVYAQNVALMPPETKKTIEDVTGVIVNKEEYTTKAMRNLSEQLLRELDDSPEAKKKALETLTGFLNGLEDEELRTLLKEAGVTNVGKVIKGIKEGNLAEDEGKSILTKMREGLENTELQNKLFSIARGIASALSSLLSVKARIEGTSSTVPGHKSGLDYVPYDNYLARLHKGERVLTAEENKQLMKMEKASKINMSSLGSKIENTKTVFTTPQIVFNVQELDEAKLNQCFNYINRKFGSQY